MRRFVSTSLGGAVLALLAACAGPASQVAERPTAPISYPETQRIDHVDTYFGVEVPDPYRWLEDLDGEETAAWVEAQNAIAQPFLDQLEERRAIQQRLTELWNYERYELPEKEGGRYFYRHNDGLQDQSILYVTSDLAGERRVLIDPNTFSDDRTTSLRQYEVSPDGSLIAYGISEGGSDWRHFRVRDVETGEDREDMLYGIKFSGASWSADSKGFYYSRYPMDEATGEADDSKQVAVYYHRLGTAQADDEEVFAITDHDTRNPYATVTDDGEYLVLRISDGYNTNGYYYRKLGAGSSSVVRLLDAWDGLYSFLGNEGDTFYFKTNVDAPLGKVVAIDLDTPKPESWRLVIPEAEETLEEVGLVGGHVIASYLKDATSLVKVYDMDGTFRRNVELPGLGTVGGFGGKIDDPETFYSYTSFYSPSQIYRYDVATGDAKLSRKPEVAIDLNQFQTRQVFFESADGTRVPMFVVHRDGIELDGSHPTLLTAYGGFNISITPNYSTSRTVWLEMGGILAIPNLRGGGEYGEAWHQAGTKLEKQNVFDDFIAAAEWLIANGYTSPERLGILGGSNGGLLVGAVMTQRPELFGATLPAVGVLDMLRYHTASANALQWSSDYGLSENEEEFHALYAYSPYHNTSEGTCYPPTLVTTADHDDRVVPWHSFKFGAALQRAQGCDQPILIRVETRAGHGAGKPTWMRIEEVANRWAFLAWALEMDS
jgi:prolyl oligopeptidase